MFERPDRLYLREHPLDELEEAFAEEEASREVDLILSRYPSSGNFSRRVISKLAQRVLAERQATKSSRALDRKEIHSDAQNPL